MTEHNCRTQYSTEPFQHHPPYPPVNHSVTP